MRQIESRWFIHDAVQRLTLGKRWCQWLKFWNNFQILTEITIPQWIMELQNSIQISRIIDETFNPHNSEKGVINNLNLVVYCFPNFEHQPMYTQDNVYRVKRSLLFNPLNMKFVHFGFIHNLSGNRLREKVLSVRMNRQARGSWKHHRQPGSCNPFHKSEEFLIFIHFFHSYSTSSALCLCNNIFHLFIPVWWSNRKENRIKGCTVNSKKYGFVKKRGNRFF